MPGDWVGPPYPNGNRECRPSGGGGHTWQDERDRLWQEEDEQGNPIGQPVPKHYDWVDTGEECEPTGT